MNKNELFDLFFNKFMGLKCANPKDEFREAFNQIIVPHLDLVPNKDELEFEEWWKDKKDDYTDGAKAQFKQGWMGARGYG